MKRGRTAPRWALDALESLVLLSSALTGADTVALLEGLAGPLIAEARRLLEASSRCSAAEQHAHCLRALRPPRRQLRARLVLPGRVGDLLRVRLAGGAPVLGELEAPEALCVQWSSRLALEQSELAAPRRPPERRGVPASGRAREPSPR
jgi:hypothetical protein